MVELVVVSTSDLHSAVTAYLGELEIDEPEGSGSGDDNDDELGGDTDEESELTGLEDSDDEDATVSNILKLC